MLLKISRTHLFSRIKQTVVAALGVTFGIGTFITMVSFMTGLNHLLDGLFLNSTPHIHLYNEFKQTEKQPVDRYEEFKNSLNIVRSVKPKQNIMRIRGALPIVRFLKQDDRVKGVIKQVTAQVFYQAGAVKLNGNVLGIEALEHDRLFTLGDYVVKGDVRDLDQTEDGIILGAGVADKMSVKMGERIVVSNAKGEIYASSLAKKIDCTYSHVVKILQEMQGSGIVNFDKQGRLKLLTLTKKGSEIAELITKVRNLM